MTLLEAVLVQFNAVCSRKLDENQSLDIFTTTGTGIVQLPIALSRGIVVFNLKFDICTGARTAFEQSGNGREAVSPVGDRRERCLEVKLNIGEDTGLQL
jgi:hypothetical protein